ncbi:hypothetical protein DFJ77DRAFT_443390 [Powellomyces hirtus]|nr:hypothetical protein DFJ77DRAFT_443390 [Powellomyces hirtus]
MPLALLTFHHLLSRKKIGLLSTHARELGLHGVYRRGYPGILLVSSPQLATAAEFAKRVKRMKWQSVRLNGITEEWSIEFEDARLVEVEKTRHVVMCARQRGITGGEKEEIWVRTALGFARED